MTLDWASPEISHLDLVYSSLALERGLYWAYESAGIAERVVSDAEIDRFVQEPPSDTRAWARAMLLRNLDPQQVEGVDWDRVRIRVPAEHGAGRSIGIALDDPLGSTREMCEALFLGAPSASALVDALVDLSGAGAESHSVGLQYSAAEILTYN